MESTIQKTRSFFSKNLALILVIISYVFFIFLYMGPSVWGCGSTLTGIGDNTGGPIWRTSIKPQQPLMGGYEKMTNFPFGENLYSPVGYASVAQTVTVRAVGAVVGPVCAYNTLNMLGYLSTAIIMFAFILYLVKSRWIAWLAGYAVAFTPYVQSKIGGHPSYGFASALIAALWLTLHILKRRQFKAGVGLALVLAFCAYFDPYFILLSITVVMPIVLVWFLYAVRVFLSSKDVHAKKKIIETVKVFALSLFTFIILLLPLAYIRIHDSKQINETTSSSRGDIATSAQQCSNLPQDYLLPDPWNTTLTRVFGPSYTARNISHRHWCGLGESRVAISLVAIFVVSVGFVVMLWERLNTRRLNLGKIVNGNPKIVIGSLMAIAVAAFLLGLPPQVRGFKMPSHYVIKLTSTWRIFAREYLVLNLAVIVVFAIVLAYFNSILNKKHKRIVVVSFVLIVLGIITEYQIHPMFDPFTFSYKRDVPSVYENIRDNPDIEAIAEFPIDRLGIETDAVVYYTTMQVEHKKPILNSVIPTNPREKIDIAIKDLTDPQTLPVLRRLGIKYVTVHGVTAEELRSKTDQLEIIKDEVPPVYGLNMIRQSPTNSIILAKVKDGPKADSVLTIQKGFLVNNLIMKSPIDVEYEVLQGSELKLVPTAGGKNSQSLRSVCFDVKMSASNDTSNLVVYVNEKPQLSVNLTGDYVPARILAKEGDVLRLQNSRGYNMRLNNLGCKN